MRRPDDDAPCRIDGRPARFAEATVPLDDGTVQHGLGLFETLATRAGRPLDLDAHLERIGDAASRLDLDWPGRERLAEEASAVADALGHESGWVKIVMTDGGRRFVFGGSFDASDEGKPVTGAILPWRLDRRSPLAGLKTTSYAGHALGTRWAEARGAGEGLWLNDRGHLAEGCRSNLFLVVGGAVLTPALSDGILPGVVRSIALEVVRERGFRVHEGKVRRDRLTRAAEAFLTSSVRGVRPLVAVDGRPVGRGEPGPITAVIAEGVRERRLAGLDPAGAAPT